MNNRTCPNCNIEFLTRVEKLDYAITNFVKANQRDRSFRIECNHCNSKLESDPMYMVIPIFASAAFAYLTAMVYQFIAVMLIGMIIGPYFSPFNVCD